MLYIKPANLEDAEKEWRFVAAIPEDENGLTNKWHGVSRERFLSEALPEMINRANGIGLPEGFVPDTTLFLWNEGEIVGQFRLRHYLPEALVPGHIGYFIAKEHRGKGFATEGLRLTLAYGASIIPEEEFFLRLNKNNPASLRVMLKNGGRIVGENEEKYFVSIPKYHTILGHTVRVTVDRPLGSYHPQHKDICYPINYGYVEGVIAPDGEEQDVYILGADKPVSEFEGIIIAVIHRNNDAEDKWIVAPEGVSFTKEEIEAAVHFQEQYFDTSVIMPVSAEGNAVIHPIPPVYDKNSKILILGSFPSVKSRETGFFYGHRQNRFWRVIAGIYGEETPDTIEAKKEMLLRHGIALWDVIKSCEISGSADSSIKNAVPNDIDKIIKSSRITAVFTNGRKADALYKKYLESKTGITAVCLPSTSPANASKSAESLIEEWKIIRNV